MLIGEKYNLEEIAKRYNLKNFLLFQSTITYELDIDIDVYSTIFSDILSKQLNENIVSRKLIFAVTKRYVKNLILPTKNTISYNPNRYFFNICN